MERVQNGIDKGFEFRARYLNTLAGERGGDPFHVLGMDWASDTPMLHIRRLKEDRGLLYYDGGVRPLDLTTLKRVDITSSSDLYCVGRTEEGHVPCPGREVAEGYAQCMECLTQDVPDPSCIFEPHCDKGTCGAFFCQVPHIVYVAVYGRRMKIGMTQLSRVRERGMEQGADVILPLVIVKDRYSARALEGWISNRYRAPEALSGQIVLKAMVRRTAPDISAGIAVSFMERLRKDQVVMTDICKGRGIEMGTLPREMPVEPIVLGPYPIPERLEALPRFMPVDVISGEAVGFKGKWMVTREGTLAAFKMPDLVGRLVLFKDR